MSFVKKLAGETVIYGMSSILPRIIHYLFFTIYITYKFEDTLQYGIYSELYAYATVILVLFLFRMDTAFFRFGSNKEDQEQIFSTALLPVIIIAILGTTLMYLNADFLSHVIQYEHGGNYVKWFAFILGFDAIAGMFYARFRLQGRPYRFLFYRVLNVVLTLVLVFLFLEVFPRLGIQIFDVQEEIDYVFIANLIASATVLFLMLPEMLKVKWKFDSALWKKMLWYSTPLVIVGIAGNINQVFAAPLQKYLLGGEARENLAVAGKYMGPAKIALLLNLFTVAFNYAAEPFFFNNVGKENSEKAYGQIIHAFTIVAGVAMVGIVCFQELVILMIGESYRGPQEIIPILLFAYLFLGLYYNVSIWYKLSDKTTYGAFISIGGAVITLAISFLFLNEYGYIVSAWASLACYTFMLVAGYVLGQVHHPIEYPVKKIIILTLILLLTIIVTILIKQQFSSDLINLGIGLLIFAFYCFIIYWKEKEEIKSYLSTT